MARRGAHRQESVAEGHPIAVPQGQGDVVGAGGFRQADGAARGLVQQPAAGDMVGMDVGVEGGHQRDAQLADQGEIPIVPLKHRIDQYALPAWHVGEQVGEGAGGGVKQLTKQQGAATRGGGQGDRGGVGGGRHGCCFNQQYDP